MWPGIRVGTGGFLALFRTTRGSTLILAYHPSQEDRIRTCDLGVPNPARYQAALPPVGVTTSRDSWIRTSDFRSPRAAL